MFWWPKHKNYINEVQSYIKNKINEQIKKLKSKVKMRATK